MKLELAKNTIYLILMTCLIVFSSSVQGKPVIESSIAVNSYISHGAIDVDGNTQFKSTATAEGWDLSGTRDGSSFAPFVISGYNITLTGTSLIKIHNTDLYFEIQGNILNGQLFSGIGIDFSNTSNVVIADNIIQGYSNAGIYSEASSNYLIINNTIMNTGYGIHFSSVNGVNVTQNDISHSSNYGIFVYGGNSDTYTFNTVTDSDSGGISLSSSSQNLVYENTVSVGGDGISVNNGHLNVIKNNHLSGLTYTGVHIQYTSNQNEVVNNTITAITHYGILIEGTSNTLDLGNNIHNNTIMSVENGMYIRYANLTLIYYNLFDNMTKDGILFQQAYNSTIQFNIIKNADALAIDFDDASYYNSVFRNQFIDNNAQGSSQASDKGPGNVFQYNYWNDWTSPDVNNDGVVDVPYQISTSAVNQADPFPIVSPDNMNVIAQPLPSTSSSGSTTTRSSTTASQNSSNTTTPYPIFGLFFGWIAIIMILKKKKY